MITYQATKKEFHNDIVSNRIVDIIREEFTRHFGFRAINGEIKAWQNSLYPMDGILSDPEIPDETGVAIEFQIPMTNKRIDFILSGLNAQKKEQLIIIELKQWSGGISFPNMDGLLMNDFWPNNPYIPHPSYQACTYTNRLRYYNETIEKDKIELNSCVYLHNYIPDNIILHSSFQKYLKDAPVFFKTQSHDFQEFIKQRICYGDTTEILRRIDNSRQRPSQQVIESLREMFEGNKVFDLLDDQKIVYERIKDIIPKAKENKKQVILVEGDPGSGKTVVAINLLVEFTQQKYMAKYVTKNAAPREICKALLSGTKTKKEINELFASSDIFWNMQDKPYDLLLVDEAHRLRQKSGLYDHLGENQIREIIRASKCVVFFVDNFQTVHIKDFGKKESILKYAKEQGAKITEFRLKSQFRCNGSSYYLPWLESMLCIKPEKPFIFPGKSFDFQIFSDPQQLWENIRQANEGKIPEHAGKNVKDLPTINKSRVIAGYCWPWESKKEPEKYDIELGNLKKRWNREEDGNLWVIAPDSIHELGCIHTCQGLDLDYIGVIIGEDLRYENGKVIADFRKRAKNDKTIRGLKKLAKTDEAKAEEIGSEIIRNTYRVLMTRGMKGCYIYCCDKKLEEYFRQHLNPTASIPEETLKKLIPIIEKDIAPQARYHTHLPVYSMTDACLKFGEGQPVKEKGWLKIPDAKSLNQNMFVIQAIGHAMEGPITDGDFCIFCCQPKGRIEGKTILAQYKDYHDKETKGNYVIRQYSYTLGKDQIPDGIRLLALNSNIQYYPPISVENEDNYRTIGEFISIVQPN